MMVSVLFAMNAEPAFSAAAAGAMKTGPADMKPTANVATAAKPSRPALPFLNLPIGEFLSARADPLSTRFDEQYAAHSRAVRDANPWSHEQARAATPIWWIEYIPPDCAQGLRGYGVAVHARPPEGDL